jgi:hypothetical protein
MAYYEQFPLPGSEPPVQAPVAARQPAGNGQFNGIPIFDVGIGGEGGQYGGPSVPADQAPSQSMPILDMAGGSYRPAVMPAAGLFISESSPVMGDIRPDFRNFDIGMVGL